MKRNRIVNEFFPTLLIKRRQMLLIFKYYRPYKTKTQRNNCIIFMADGHFGSNGLFDRLKGIVTLYALSKATGKDFKIFFTSPFNLKDFLVPNLYDWTIESPYYHFPASIPEIVNSNNLFYARNNERHCYCMTDALDLINKRYSKSFSFKSLYKELFKPSEYLEKIIRERECPSKSYIAIHVRIVNLLGENIEKAAGFEALSQPDQSKLINNLMMKINEIIKKHEGLDTYLFTDSNKFSKFAQLSNEKIKIVQGNIAHIGNHDKVSLESVSKLFLDYHYISKAIKVYSIIGNGLYPSAFPLYAAKIGDVPFIRIAMS